MLLKSGFSFQIFRIAMVCVASGLAVGIPGSRVPYKDVKEGKVYADGLPEGVVLKNPSAYGENTARRILNFSTSITFKGLFTKSSTELAKHVLII
jgi:hypothetical protein